MGSPFTASLCHPVADHGLPERATWQRIAHWPDFDVLAGDGVALRFAGGRDAERAKRAEEKPDQARLPCDQPQGSGQARCRAAGE